MKPCFRLIKDKKGEFRFSLISLNGRVISTSEGYTTKYNAIGGMLSVVNNSIQMVAPKAWRKELTKDDLKIEDLTNQ